MRKKVILIIVISILLIASLAVVYFFLLKDKELSITGTVLVSGENYVILETKDGDYLVENAGSYQIGDEVEFTYMKKSLNENTSPKEITAQSGKLIQASSKNIEDETLNDADDDIQENNSSNIPSSNNASSSPNSSNDSKNDVTANDDNKQINSQNTPSNSGNNTTPNQTTRSADEEVLSYVNTLQTNVNNGITDNLKSGFITIVDFLFYDGTIAGHTFNELTTSAKLEVLKAALWVDDKIDNVFPEYKETISNGANKVYTSVKNMVVSTYLDITTSICSSNSDLCESAKRDFQSLKQSFGFTWDMIKDLASSGLDKLKNWYEIWSGK